MIQQKAREVTYPLITSFSNFLIDHPQHKNSDYLVIQQKAREVAYSLITTFTNFLIDHPQHGMLPKDVGHVTVSVG